MPHKSKARNVDIQREVNSIEVNHRGTRKYSKKSFNNHRQMRSPHGNPAGKKETGTDQSDSPAVKLAFTNTRLSLDQDPYTSPSTNTASAAPRTRWPETAREINNEGSDNEEVLLFFGRNQIHPSTRTSRQASSARQDTSVSRKMIHRSSSQRSQTSSDGQEGSLRSRSSPFMESRRNFSRRALDISAKSLDMNEDALTDYIENVEQEDLSDRSVQYVTDPLPQIDDKKVGSYIEEEHLPIRQKGATASSLISKGMTDEAIAERLAKQEELGLGSAELLLFDGTDDLVGSDADLGDPDLAFLRNEARQYVHKSKRQRDGKLTSLLPAIDDWSSGTDGDQYNEFDILDPDRPSLQASGGRRSQTRSELINFGVDSTMIHMWENDRRKKGAKKQERELLRAQGLLGSGSGGDLRDKYPEGMNWDSIRDELKAFLLSNRQTLTLVPMEKHDRRIVHEIANRFGVKSHSKGSGRQRYPCLTKTKRTRAFNDDVFSMLESRFTQRFFPRMGKSKFTRKPQHRANDAGAAYVAYQDGEIVGAAAPELGAENRGRAMLERMGWSSGTALGALDNKGLLLPLSHAVKKTRTGLG